MFRSQVEALLGLAMAGFDIVVIRLDQAAE